MALTCPTCKRRYDDDHVYCEECGGTLVPAPPSWRKWVVLGLGLVLVVGGAWFVVDYIQSDVQSNVRVELAPDKDIEEVFNKKLKDAKDLKVPVLIKNDSMINFTVESVNCQATFLGTKWECKSDTPQETSKGNWKVPLNVKGEADSAPSLSSSVEVTVDVRFWGIPVHISRVTLVPSEAIIRAALSEPATSREPTPRREPREPKDKDKDQEKDSGGGFRITKHSKSDIQKAADKAVDQAKKLGDKVNSGGDKND